MATVELWEPKDMSQSSKFTEHKARTKGQTYLSFFCPGCDCSHMITVGGPGDWKLHGTMERPTITKDGNLEYLSDCKHDLAGKTIPMRNADEEPTR